MDNQKFFCPNCGKPISKNDIFARNAASTLKNIWLAFRLNQRIILIMILSGQPNQHQLSRRHQLNRLQALSSGTVGHHGRP